MRNQGSQGTPLFDLIGEQESQSSSLPLFPDLRIEMPSRPLLLHSEPISEPVSLYSPPERKRRGNQRQFSGPSLFDGLSMPPRQPQEISTLTELCEKYSLTLINQNAVDSHPAQVAFWNRFFGGKRQENHPSVLSSSRSRDLLIENAVLDAPTGSGKTFMALVAASYFLQSNQKVLYLVRTIEMVDQTKGDAIVSLNIPTEAMLTLSGSTVRPSKRAELYTGAARIIFSTPELITNDIKNKRLDPALFSFVVFDECHHTVGGDVYTYLGDVFKRSGATVLACSATVGKNPSEERMIFNELGVLPGREQPGRHLVVNMPLPLKRIVDSLITLPPEMATCADLLKDHGHERRNSWKTWLSRFQGILYQDQPGFRGFGRYIPKPAPNFYFFSQKKYEHLGVVFQDLVSVASEWEAQAKEKGQPKPLLNEFNISTRSAAYTIQRGFWQERYLSYLHSCLTGLGVYPFLHHTCSRIAAMLAEGSGQVGMPEMGYAVKNLYSPTHSESRELRKIIRRVASGTVFEPILNSQSWNDVLIKTLPDTDWTKVKTQEQFRTVFKLLRTAFVRSGQVSHPKDTKVVDAILAAKSQKLGQVIAFCGEREYAEYLKELINYQGLVLDASAVSILGGNSNGVKPHQSRKERRESLTQFRERGPVALIATSTADEGLSIPKTSTAILTQPTPMLVKFIQRLGRLSRAEGTVSMDGVGVCTVLIAEGTSEPYVYRSGLRKLLRKAVIDRESRIN